jgi:pilus assembly protein CpaF
MGVAIGGLADLEQRVLASVELQLAARLGSRATPCVGPADAEWVQELIGQVVAEEHRLAGLQVSAEASAALSRRVFGAITPLGPVAEQLADPEVEEIRLNGTRSCYVLRGGRRFEIAPPFAEESALLELVRWYAGGDRLTQVVAQPLPDGSHLQAVLPPLARPVSVIIRRRVGSRLRDLQDLVAAGFLPDALAPFLEAAIRGRLNVLIAGGRGTGKTTFLRVLCGLIPDTERVVTIEDQAELHLWKERPDCISLEGRGEIEIPKLLREALRLSPDRIVLGEVCGAEAFDLLDAMSSGFPGSICSFHSESARDTLPRLARLALRSPAALRPEAVSAEVGRTVDLVLHLGVSSKGGLRRRRLQSIGMVRDQVAGQPLVEDLAGVESVPERVAAKLEAAGYDPALLPGLVRA